MNMRKVVVGIVAGGLLMLAGPEANAVCFWCDETGCHATTGPCPPPPPPEEMATTPPDDGGNTSRSTSAATFTGGCDLVTFNDTTPGGQLGGQYVWNGSVRIAVVPAQAGTPADVRCTLKVNGVDQGTVLTGSGTGLVFAAGQLQYTAASTDVVSLCTTVTSVSGTETTCADVIVTQVVPQPVVDALYTVLALINNVQSPSDPTACAALIAAAPVVDSLGLGATFIDPATGDWYTGGSLVDAFYDCPPYQATT